jgi:hypothetical protein
MRKIVLAIVTILVGSNAYAQECISHTAEEGAVYGEADFVGEPWQYQWVVDQEWDNDQGEWVSIDPVTYTLDVPGEAIMFRFSDGSEFVYGADLVPSAKADNLSTISQYGYGNEAGPYQAVRTTTGEIFMLDEERCEPVSWNLAH